LALFEGFVELGRLEPEDPYLLCIDLPLFAQLLGLDYEHLGLVADLLRLPAERQDREGRRDDREDGKDRGGYGGNLARQVH
jgi:hypothetical protein